MYLVIVQIRGTLGAFHTINLVERHRYLRTFIRTARLQQSTMASLTDKRFH
jgi:hypothetical protein